MLPKRFNNGRSTRNARKVRARSSRIAERMQTNTMQTAEQMRVNSNTSQIKEGIDAQSSSNIIRIVEELDNVQTSPLNRSSNED